MKAVSFACAALILATGCGGRPTLDDNAGRSYGQIMQAQRESRPRRASMPLSALDAKIAMANHESEYRRGGGQTSSVAGQVPGGARGLLSSMMNANVEDLGGGDDGGGGSTRPIRLQAK